MLPGTGRHARLSRWLGAPHAAQETYALNIRLKMRVAIMPADV